jgi:dipeptidyl aminopeptidase/acylaminoacyl peptidase
MLEAVAKFSSPPEGVVVANGFASLRSLPQARNHIFYRILSYAIPDWWNNVRSAAQLRAPLLVIHSDFDSVNPVDGARAIFAAAREPKALVILHGYRHNALYQNPREEWWNPVLGFVAQKK